VVSFIGVVNAEGRLSWARTFTAVRRRSARDERRRDADREDIFVLFMIIFPFS
jgi:hypothetical protein